MPKFIPGLELSRLYFQKEIQPILRKKFPKLKYSAAVIGWGSEVLGLDTPQSRDHHWGPRVILFLSETDHPKLEKKMLRELAHNLPYEFMGYSTNFSKPQPNGVRHPVKITSGPVDPMVNIFTVRSFFELRLGFDPYKSITPIDWLTFPQQRLLEIQRGAIYRDDLRRLSKIRAKFSYYPHDVWLYLLASQWTKISQEEAFVGRTGDVGDELGSQSVAARIVREIMRLSFLMEKEYFPYTKWFGSTFDQLPIARSLSPVLRKVMLAKTWKQREKELGKAYTLIAKKHNSLRITKPLPTAVSDYYGRPYLVIHADQFAAALRSQIRSQKIRHLPLIGSIDQFTDSVDVSNTMKLLKALGGAYKVK